MSLLLNEWHVAIFHVDREHLVLLDQIITRLAHSLLPDFWTFP